MEPPPPAPRVQTPPSLPLLPSTPHSFAIPRKRIIEGHDVPHFLTSQAYRDIGLFIMQLNRAMVPRRVVNPANGREQSRSWGLTTMSSSGIPDSVKGLRGLMAEAEKLIGETPPDPGPRRFGNKSFRIWHGKIAEKAGVWLREYLPKSVVEFPVADSRSSAGRSEDNGGGEGDEDEGVKGAAGPLDELAPYFLGGFGSEQRLDYGTGHELSFLAFLGGIWKLGGFGDGEQGGDIERRIVLHVIEPYLQLVRRLITTYTLEPAGSHGVWGLDDHSFLPYIFGSAQLTRAIREDEPTPLEGSVRGAPAPADVVKANAVEKERENNLYFSAIGFIYDVKKGPFWEHSPILFDISGVRDGWGKINKGMIKMYNAEVLSKFPVVQHFPFGTLFSWTTDPEAPAPQPSTHVSNHPLSQPSTAHPGGPSPQGTGAPWAQSQPSTPFSGPGSSGPGIPYSRVPPRPGAGAGGLRGGTTMPSVQAPWKK